MTAGRRRRRAPVARPPRGRQDLRIRLPGWGDLDDWARLRHALWPEDVLASHRAATERGFAESAPVDPAARPGPRRALLATADGAIVGFVEVSLRAYADGCSTSPVGYLEGLYVVPKFRGRGIARELVRAAEAWAIGLGCTEMASDAFTTNRGSRGFHRSSGYSEVEVLVHFRKRLLRSRRPPRTSVR